MRWFLQIFFLKNGNLCNQNRYTYLYSYSRSREGVSIYSENIFLTEFNFAEKTWFLQIFTEFFWNTREFPGIRHRIWRITVEKLHRMTGYTWFPKNSTKLTRILGNSLEFHENPLKFLKSVQNPWNGHSSISSERRIIRNKIDHVGNTKNTKIEQNKKKHQKMRQQNGKKYKNYKKVPRNTKSSYSWIIRF